MWVVISPYEIMDTFNTEVAAGLNLNLFQLNVIIINQAINRVAEVIIVSHILRSLKHSEMDNHKLVVEFSISQHPLGYVQTL